MLNNYLLMFIIEFLILKDNLSKTKHNIVYKTFGNQWVSEYFSSYQKYLYLNSKVLRNTKRFIYVTVSINFSASEILIS